MKIIQSNLLKKFTNLTHGFTTRQIGNLAFHVDDDFTNVTINHQALADLMCYEKHKLIHMKQIHSSLVHTITSNDNFSNPHSCDALVTDKPNIPLMVMVADCSPILFYDNKKQVIAVAHAGREGAFRNIVKNTIDKMQFQFNSEIENIYVTIGASIGACCYEIGDKIYKQTKELGLDYALEMRETSYYLNISKILKNQLKASGIKDKHIDISKECTCCKNDKYYSYRANKKTGRFAGVIMLNKKI
jgi:YfiH family protein